MANGFSVTMNAQKQARIEAAFMGLYSDPMNTGATQVVIDHIKAYLKEQTRNYEKQVAQQQVPPVTDVDI